MHGFMESGGSRRFCPIQEFFEQLQFAAEEVPPVVNERPLIVQEFGTHLVGIPFRGLLGRGGEFFRRKRIFTRGGSRLCFRHLQVDGVDELQAFSELTTRQFVIARNLKPLLDRTVDRLVVRTGGLRPACYSLLNLELFGGRYRGLAGGGVLSVPADGGKDFGRNPALESLCGFELGTEDQGIETGLVDAVDRLSTSELVGDFLLDEVFGVDVLRYSVRGLLEAES